MNLRKILRKIAGLTVMITILLGASCRVEFEPWGDTDEYVAWIGTAVYCSRVGLSGQTAEEALRIEAACLASLVYLAAVADEDDDW